MASSTGNFASQFDVVEYGALYDGFTKLQRLTFIAENVPSLRSACNRELLKALKDSSNVQLYQRTYQSVDEETRRELGCDETRIQTMNQNNQVRMDILETELSTAKSTMLKEGIRMGHNDIGHMMYQVGNLGEALKAFLRSRDFCTLPRHNIEMCLNVIGVSIDLKQFFNVTNFIGKVVDTLGDDVVLGKLKAASALVDLHDRQFKSAAVKFLEVSTSLGNQFNTALSAQDIAMYGTICALATFERAELRAKLIDNKAFVNAYLNLVPDVKSLAFSFYNGQYAAALQALTAVKPRLQYDLYLHSSVDKLVAMMRERMLLQSFAPYCSVDLSRMASQLQLEPAALEDALVELISSGKLAARIDARANTLVRRERNVREETLEKVLSASTVHGHAIRRDILRLSMLQQGFVVGGAVEEGAVTLERANLSRQHSGSGAGGEYETAAFEMTGEEQMYEASHGMEGYREGGADRHVAYLSQSTVGEDAVMQMMQEEEYGSNM